jgi:hypothetical protein
MLFVKGEVKVERDGEKLIARLEGLGSWGVEEEVGDLDYIMEW